MFSIHYVYSFTKINKLEKKIIFRLNNLIAFFVNIVMGWVWMPCTCVKVWMPCAYVEYTCLVPVYGCLVHMYNIPALYMCYSNVCLYVHVYMILSLFMNKCVSSWLVKIWYISQICNEQFLSLLSLILVYFGKKFHFFIKIYFIAYVLFCQNNYKMMIFFSTFISTFVDGGKVYTTNDMYSLLDYCSHT